MANQTKIIDLIKPSSDIQANPKIQSMLEKGNVTILAKNLVKSLPELKPLGDLPVYGIRKLKDGGTVCYTPSLYRTSNGLKVCLPDLNASETNLLTLVSICLSENDAHCILTDGKINLKCNLGIELDGLNRLKGMKSIHSETFNADDIPENVASIIRERPILELPLSNLDLNKTYEIISHDGHSKKYETPLIGLLAEDGTELHNVITNADLRRYGTIGASFKITLIEDVKVKKDKKNEIMKKYHISWSDASIDLDL